MDQHDVIRRGIALDELARCYSDLQAALIKSIWFQELGSGERKVILNHVRRIVNAEKHLWQLEAKMDGIDQDCQF